MEIKSILEACLLSSAVPLSLEQLQAVFEEGQQPSFEDLRGALDSLTIEYTNAAVALVQVASGYSFRVKPKYAPWVARLQIEKPSKYSRALLETLAIIAYKQPVTRAEMEDIRGVAVSSQIMKTLLEREWIKVAGHKDLPGKPAVYVTTKDFLDYFNLRSLQELPPMLDTLVHDE